MILIHQNYCQVMITIIVVTQILLLVNEKSMDIKDAEKIVHDVLNVFMLTGFTNDTNQYFMKASPARPGLFRIFC